MQPPAHFNNLKPNYGGKSRTLNASHPRLTSSVLGTPYYLMRSIEGVEAINQLFEYTVILSTQDEYGQGILATTSALPRRVKTMPKVTMVHRVLTLTSKASSVPT